MPVAIKASRDQGPGAAIGALMRNRVAQFAWFLAFALLTRASVFGDTNYFNDEYFYFQTGIRMHQGLLPYVDIWDRKGPGLFLTYWLIAFFSHAVIAYQLAALLFAAATAQVAALIAGRYTGRVGAILAGTLYLTLLSWLGGGGGQTPVFYNLWMALAALGVVRAGPAMCRGEAPRQLYAAMASAGLALTYKQSAIVECLFLGLWALWQMARSGVSPRDLLARALGMALAGIAPMCAFALYFAAAGHFAEFWHAMVTANLRKSYAADDLAVRIRAFALMFSPAWVPALGALLPLWPRDPERPLAFLLGWTLAALVGVVMLPNFYEHYLLPLCLPVSVLAARFLGFRLIGPADALLSIGFMLSAGPALDFARRDASRLAMSQLVRDIAARDPHPRLLVYSGPVDLYRQFGSYPPSPLYYPTHLSFASEIDVSHLSTRTELLRILAGRPSVVLVYARPALERIPLSGPLVHDYVARNCRKWFTRALPEVYITQTVDVWGDCARRP